MSVPGGTGDRDSGRDFMVGAGLLLLAVFCRLGFVRSYPTLPISDFRAIVAFGLSLRDHGLAAPSALWTIFNPGLPMVLSLLFRWAPADPVATARISTAIWTGTLPVFPFFLWRGVAPLRIRFAAGLLLALWPGQIAFSGVVAQDNWVLVPTVALACLAARRLLDSSGRTHPIAAGLLYAFAVAIRQEMLLVLAPLVLAAAFSRRRGGLARDGGILLLAAGIPLALLAVQRGHATGRYALTTEHGGLALLGSFVPGAFDAGWIDPRVWVASNHPALLEDPRRLEAAAGRLAFEEARRRPGFHLARIGAEVARMALRGDASNLYWSVSGEETLPPGKRAAGLALQKDWGPALSAELALIQGAFVVAVLVGAKRRNAAVLILALTALLKIGLHAIASPMSRLLMPATALELLTIALAASEWPGLSPRARDAVVLAPFLFAFALNDVVPRLERAVERRDLAAPSRYRFPLAVPGGGTPVWCELAPGRLRRLEDARAEIALPADEPSPGERARLACTIPAAAGALVLRVEDRYAPGGYAGRVLERVEVDGREVLRHDVAAEPFAGWLEVPIAAGQNGKARSAVFEILAVSPDRGWGWGTATAAGVEIVRPREPLGAEVRRVPAAP